jgi:hypothetical protein
MRSDLRYACRTAKIVESCRSVRLNKYASWGSVVVMFFVTRVVREKKE